MSQPNDEPTPAQPDEGEAEPRFSDAIGDLEAILRRIEDEEIDIDELAEELQRAAELLEVCRGKIRKAEVEVTQIVQRLENDDGGRDDESDDAGAAGSGGEED